MLTTRLALTGSRGRFRSPSVIAEGLRPTVSVVVPCYNYGHYLENCVRTILDQPGVEVEVIIVDDCSPDGSAEAAATLAEGDPRVQLIRHTENKGHIATYNDGLAATTGEYVTLVSADDLLTPGALSRAVALMEAEPSVGFVYGPTARFSVKIPEVSITTRGWIVWRGEDWLALRCRSGYNVIASPEVVMRASLMRKIGGYREDLPHGGDFEMWMRAASAADVGYLVGAVQALYRLHDMNMHKTMFGAGHFSGQLIDLEQREASLRAIFDEPGDLSARAQRLRVTAKRTMAVQALDHANYAFARGFVDFPVEQFERVAHRIDPGVGRTSAGRALARRKSRGMSTLPIHPLWAPRAVKLRVEEGLRRWRRSLVGI